MTVELRSLRTQVLINDGTDDLDVSTAFESVTLSTAVWDDSGWFKPRGPLVLWAYVDTVAESFDPRVNPTRWAPGNVVKISVWFGSWIALPWRLRILSYPNRPYPGNPQITVELGTDADLLNYRAPEGDPEGVTYGTGTSVATLINAALTQAGAPALTDSIAGLSLPFSPEKNTGSSWMTYAGKAAYAAGQVLWQQTDGAIRAAALTTSGLSSFAAYTIGTDESDYVPDGSQESPPEDVRFTGSTYLIDAVDDGCETNTDTVDGVTVRTTICYTGRDSDTPTYTETVEQPANVVLPAYFSTTILIIDSELEKVDTYGIGAILTEQVETVRRPVGVLFPAEVFGAPSTLGIESRQTIEYTYDTANVLRIRKTTLERAALSGATVTTAIAQVTTERWESAGGEQYTYSRTIVNRDGSTPSLPQRRGASTNNKPPATQYKPAENQRTERQYHGQATFKSVAGNGFAEKLWSVELPSGMCTSDQQCRDRAETWGSIRQGRQFGISWSADLTQAWLQSFTPVRRVDFTLGNTRTSYLVEALQLAIDARSAAIGGRGVEIGTVELDGTGTPSAAFTVEFVADVAIAGGIGALTGSVSVLQPGQIAIAGSLGPVDGAVSVDVADVVAIAGSVGPVSGSVSVAVSDTVAIAGSLGPVDGSVSVTLPNQVAVAGAIGPVNGSVVVDVLWTPAEITTAGWWDASDSTTLFDATSGGSAVSADGAIARWEDKSGNARHWKQSTLGDRPLRKAAQVNSLDTVLFDGTSDGMLLDADLSFTSHTIFVMFRPSATITDASASEAFLTGGTFGSGTAETLLLTGSVTGNLSGERLSHLIVQDSPVAQVYGYAKTNADVSGVNQFALQWNDSTTTFAGYLNGNTDFAATSSAGGFSSGRKPTDIRYLGYRGLNNTAHLGADICEVVILSSAATTDTRQRVEGYLAHRWGTTASLPGGHPYKTNPPLV
jgi:hypothetical protein